MDNDVDLLGCPFCGSAAVLRGGPEWSVECTYIGCCPGHNHHGYTYKKDAVGLWNTRHQPKQEGLVPLDMRTVWSMISLMREWGVEVSPVPSEVAKAICSRFSTPNVLDLVELCSLCEGIHRDVCSQCMGRGLILKETKHG